MVISLSCSLFLLILSPVLGNRVFAQTGTPVPLPTNTPTDEPFFKTSTPQPTKNLSCQYVGTPVGWGVRTPVALWSSSCGQCPNVPKPTAGPGSIFYQTQVPPTVTPLFTPTATVKPMTGGSIRIDGPTSGSITVLSSMYGVPQVFASAYSPYSILNQIIFFNADGYFHFTFVYDWTGNKADTWQSNTVKIGMSVPNYLTAAGMNVKTTGYYQYGSNNVPLNYEGVIKTGGSEVMLFNMTPVIGALKGQLTVEFSGVCTADSYHSCDFKVYHSVGTASGSTLNGGFTVWKGSKPADPLPGDGGYCSVVDGYAANDPQNANSIIGLPSMTLGWARCATITGVDIPLTWIPGREGLGMPETLSWPGLQICFRPIKFGYLSFLGLDIDLDLMALAMGGIFIVRKIMS